MKVTIHSIKELQKFAAIMQKHTPPGSVIALIGELGAGKTAFTKLFLKAAGVRKKITSPTFVLMVPYKKSGKTFYHLDLYRTKNFREVRTLGIEQIWKETKNILLIEWADKIRKYLPKKSIILTFKVRGQNRIIEIKNAPANLKNLLKSI